MMASPAYHFSSRSVFFRPFPFFLFFISKPVSNIHSALLGWIRMIEKRREEKIREEKIREEKRREEKRREDNSLPIIIPVTPKKYSLLNSSCGKNTISRQNQYEQKINFDFANFSHFNL